VDEAAAPIGEVGRDDVLALSDLFVELLLIALCPGQPPGEHRIDDDAPDVILSSIIGQAKKSTSSSR
jgi:hypothetical protein